MRQWQRAFILFDEMHMAFRDPDAITYCTMISTCDRGPEFLWETALSLLDDIVVFAS